MTTTLDSLIKKGTIKVGTDESFEVEYVSTGLPRLDDMLGGGFIRGKYYLTVGEWSSGKSFLALRAIVDAQSKGLTTALVDTEASYDPRWAARVGVDNSKLLIARCNEGEDVIDIVQKLLEAEVDVVVVDSLMGMIPSAEIERDAHEEGRQEHPKLVSKAVRTWLRCNTRSVLLLVNHIRTMEVIPGGEAQSYFAAGILRVKRAGLIKEGMGDKEKVYGFNMRVILRKSKQSKPWTRMSIPFMYSGLLDELGADVDYGIDAGVITRKGPWYEYGGEKWLGRGKVVEFFKDAERHAELLEKLRDVGPLAEPDDDEDEDE